MERDLDKFSRSAACENPKLKKLQDIILSYYATNENAQGIVFCKTREMTFALMNWMKDSPPLAVLNPHNITGARKTDTHGQSACYIIAVYLYNNNNNNNNNNNTLYKHSHHHNKSYMYMLYIVYILLYVSYIDL